MNNKFALTIVSVLSVILLTNCTKVPKEVTIYSQLTLGESPITVDGIPDSPNKMNNLSCAQPSPEMAARCREMEEVILASTVRLELFRWSDKNGRQGEYIAGGSSHATIKDGRYLVTHNHYGELLTALLNQGIPGEYIRMALYKADGSLILSNIPLEDVTIVAEEAETLVLEMKGEGNLGFFEMRNLPTAKFADWRTLPLQSGTEVAQVDWDGEGTSFVRWTTIDNLIRDDNTPQISLMSYVAQGASGGGVFWNELHIGNNWFRTREQNRQTGEVLTQSSMAALNSVEVAAVITLSQDAPQITLESDDYLNDHGLKGGTGQISY